MLQYLSWDESERLINEGKAVEVIGYSDYSGGYVDVVNVEFLEGRKHYLEGLYRSNGNYGSVRVIGVPEEYDDEVRDYLHDMKDNAILDEDAYWRLVIRLQEEYYESLSAGLSEEDRETLGKIMDESEVIIEYPYGAYCKAAEEFVKLKEIRKEFFKNSSRILPSPAIYTEREKTINETEGAMDKWEREGKRGYERGPAIDEQDKPKSWYRNERPFRTDCPTVEYKDGSRKDWYVKLTE